MSEADDIEAGGTLLATAADWHARLQSDAAVEADWVAFEAWLAADPAHLDAYDAVSMADAEIDAAAPDLGRAMEEAARPRVVSDEATPASLPARGARTRRRPGPMAPWMWMPAAAAAALAAWIVFPHGLGGLPVTDYATAVGETRTISLADGSTVKLNSGSHISVRLQKDARRVTMADAEAVFDVAKDPARPFIITAGDRSVTVVGTQFNVLRHDGQLTVTVRRGVVKVAPTGGGASDAARLTVGQQLVHREGAPGSTVATVAPDEAFAWLDHRLVYRDRPLSAVVADLNRYFPTPIRISGDAVAKLKFSGVLTLDSQGAVVGRLEAYLPVKAERNDGVITLRARP